MEMSEAIKNSISYKHQGSSSTSFEPYTGNASKATRTGTEAGRKTQCQCGISEVFNANPIIFS